MTDKDQFTFDDDDDFPETDLGERAPLPEAELNAKEFPETDLGDRKLSPEAELNDDEFPENDLSTAFSEGEHSAEDMHDEVPAMSEQDGGNSRMRMLLILLLVIAGGAGAYYFMDLGGTSPAVPTVAVPAQTASKSVALPPPPASEPATPVPTEQVTTPVTVAVPPPPSEPAAQQASVQQPAEKVVAEQPAAEAAKPAAVEAVVPSPAPETATQEQAAAVAASLPADTAKAEMPAPSPKQVEGGAYALDAGSYLLESNRDQLVKKIKKLGYEPLVTPVDATLDMTRLRLGTFSKDEVQEALAFARTIEPGSYSAPAGDLYVIYAGTFMKSGNVDKLTQRFLAEGIVVHPEPVQVVRTLSRVLFGSFASKEDATAAAHQVSQNGLKAAVVKSK